MWLLGVIKSPSVLVEDVAVSPLSDIEKLFAVGFVDEPYIVEPSTSPISTRNIPLVVFDDKDTFALVSVYVLVVVLSVKAST